MAEISGPGGAGARDAAAEARRAEAQRAAEARAQAARAAAEQAAAAARPAPQVQSGFDPAVRPLVELNRVPSPAATQAAERVTAARTSYVAARDAVDRLNGQLGRALSTEPALRDPAAAQRFTAAFQEQHRDVYEAEKSAARDLAAALRTAEPLIRADGMTLQNTRNRFQILDGLSTLATSSEYAQAGELAGRYSSGADATIPREVMQPIAERAALTGLREELSAGVPAEDAVRNASAVLGAAGFLGRTPALSAIGSAIGAGADVSDFMRTGDPASLGAAGFGALGTAAGVTAVFASGPIAVGAGVVGGLALGGKFIFRQMAGDNEYRQAVRGAMAQTHGLTLDQADTLMGTDSRWLTGSGLTSDELGALARSGHLHDARMAYAEGYNDSTGQYGDNLTYEAVEARARVISEANPGLPYFAAQDRAMTELRAEHRAAAGTPAEDFRAELRRRGYLE